MSKPTVLIGFAEAIAAPEVAWSLFDDGFRVVAFARRGKASGLRYSRHVEYREICSPESDVQESQSNLRGLMASLDGEIGDAERILFPLDDTSVWLCSQASADSTWHLAGPSNRLADLALNKEVQTNAARESGFNVPKTVVIRTANEVINLPDLERFPIVLKPVECVPLGKGRVQKCKIWTCADSRELDQASAEWGERVPLLAQEFIKGNGEGIFGFATPRGVQAWSAHRRLRMMNPQGSGSSACISEVVDPEIKARAEKLISTTGWSGLFMIELLRDHAGVPWFIEFNGRPWGSMALSRRQGLEYPAWQVRLALGQEPQAEKQSAVTPGVVCRHAGRELMHLLFVLRGPRTRAMSNWPSFWKTLAKVLPFRGKDTLYNWRREDLKVFFADFYFTLRNNLVKSEN